MIKNIVFEIKQTFRKVVLLRWTSSKLTVGKWVEEKNNKRNSEPIIKPQRKGIIDCEYICIFQISKCENTTVSPRSLRSLDFIMIPFYFFFYISIFDKSIIVIIVILQNNSNWSYIFEKIDLVGIKNIVDFCVFVCTHKINTI